MKKKVFYGWWIVLATNIICMLGFGTWLYSFGVFFKPMMAEFGWTRAMTAGAASLRSVEGGVAGPVVGWAVDKYGARIVILIGGVISGLGFALMPFVNSLLGFYLIYGIILSIGMSAMLYIPAFTVIAQWFSRKLSLAMSLLAVGAGVGGLICTPIAAVLITHFGWRFAFLAMGITIWIVVIPLALVIKNNPQEIGLEVDGDPPRGDNYIETNSNAELKEESADPQSATNYTLRQAFASSKFWIIASVQFCMNLAHSMVFVHTIPALTDTGISAEKAAVAMGMLTMVSVAGRLSFGILGDYIGKRYLMMFAHFLMGAGIIFLMNAQEMMTVYLFIALFGVGFGATVPLTSAIRAEYFGREALGKIHGFMSPVSMIAGLIGPVGAGYLFDITGTYRGGFLTIALVVSIAGVFILAIGRPAPQKR